MANLCKHDRTKMSDGVRCFVSSVAVHPYTDENRAAHGGYTTDEICLDCGAVRAVNCNGRHVEVGPWGPSAAEIAERERQAKAAKRQAECDREDAALAAHKAEVIRVNRDGYALVTVDGETKWVWSGDVEAAAVQKDTGDDLVPFYRGLAREIANAE